MVFAVELTVVRVVVNRLLELSLWLLELVVATFLSLISARSFAPTVFPVAIFILTVSAESPLTILIIILYSS